MKHNYKRSDRVKDLIFREISQMITQREVKDPRVASAVITNVKLSDDLGHATVFFIPLTEGMDTQEMSEGFKSSSGFIRKQLADRIKIKRIPTLEFKFDEFLQRTHELDDIIKDL